MAEKRKYIASLDIGTTKIVTTLGYIRADNKIEIIGISRVASRGVKRGIVLNIEETVYAIKTTIEDIYNQTGFRIKYLNVGIAGQHIRTIINRGYINIDSNDNEISDSVIKELVQNMYQTPIDVGEEIIQIIPVEFTVDNEHGIRNPIGMSGLKLEANFHVIIGQNSSIQNIKKCVSLAGLEINKIILEPVASSLAVLSDEEKENGVAVVDMGGGTTDIAVYHEALIRHLAVIPFGGNIITHDIKESCSILNRQAEALKIQFGSAISDLSPEDKVITIPGISGRSPKEISFKSLAYIIQSRLEEIIDAIIFEIESSGISDKLKSGMVLTGGSALLKDFSKLITQRTGLEVRIGFPENIIGKKNTIDIKSPIYSAGIGLLLSPISDILNDNIVSIDYIIPKEAKEYKSKSLFDSIKKSISSLFEEKE